MRPPVAGFHRALNPPPLWMLSVLNCEIDDKAKNLFCQVKVFVFLKFLNGKGMFMNFDDLVKGDPRQLYCVAPK